MDSTNCRICGRLLTNTKSVKRGIGPVCWAALKRDWGTKEDLGIQEYLHTFELHQNDKKVGTFKTNAITKTSGQGQAPILARGLLHFNIYEGEVTEGGVEMRGYMGDPKTSALFKITGVNFRDYNFGDPIVTDMEALKLEMIVSPETHPHLFRDEADVPDCYGSYGSEECIEDCNFQVSCEKEETKRFEKALEAEG